MILIKETADTVKTYHNGLTDKVDWNAVGNGQIVVHLNDEMSALVVDHMFSRVNTGTEEEPVWEPKRVRIVDAEVQLLPNVSAGDTPEQTIAGYRMV